MTSDNVKRATLYRMVMDQHICPFGLKARDLLERAGFTVDDHHLTSKAETEAGVQGGPRRRNRDAGIHSGPANRRL